MCYDIIIDNGKSLTFRFHINRRLLKNDVETFFFQVTTTLFLEII